MATIYFLLSGGAGLGLKHGNNSTFFLAEVLARV